MHVDILLGLQWGDEGKGKIVDHLADKYDIIARFQGGPNAGHTLVINGVKTILRTVPSGILHDRPKNVIGNGVVIDPSTLKKEIEELIAKGVPVKERLLISKKAHLILPTHRLLDAASEKAKGESSIGSTLRGISPTYLGKTGREGLRVGDLLSADFKARYERIREKHLNQLTAFYPAFEYDLEKSEQEWLEAVEFLKSLDENLIDSEYYLNGMLDNRKTILAEGAQGTMLDIDFGTYPYVTSSNTTASGACQGLGISPRRVKDVYGISKAYCTRVGNGPFPTELDNELGEKIRQLGQEFGAVTSRPRRTGWMDVVALQYACMLSDVNKLIITKADVLNDFDTIKACRHYNTAEGKTNQIPYGICDTGITPKYIDFPGWKTDLRKIQTYEELPEQLRQYLSYLEGQTNTEVVMVSTGPERSELLIKELVSVEK
jgi:adenylosuccinate synthase